jgi:MinD superfamily P-loop ATPase
MIKRAYIDSELCDQSQDCEAMGHCAKEAITYEEGKIYINQFCNGCGKCKKHCVNKAIKLV